MLVAASVASCSGGGDKKATPTPSASPTVSPTPTGLALTGDPLTGQGVVAGPVVAVKVDNGGLARPFQRGMTQAAIVYQELVEGGETRFLAIFESRKATSEVGPIRSARESDVDLLRGFGRPALAYSGANTGVLAIFRAAARAGYLYDASRNAASSLYRFGGSRRDANNYFAVPAKLGAKIGGSEPKDIGWRFGAASAPGTPTAAASVQYAGSSSTMKARYVATSGTWTISELGRTVPVAPANVIIQSVAIKPSRFYDVHGKNTPYTVTTGSGNVVLLRDGQRYVGRWQRAGFGPTRFVDAQGKDLLLKPGPTWVFLLPSKQVPSFS
jgi:hypothetical protein